MPATNELLHQGRYRIEHQFEQYGDGALFQAYDTVRAVNVVVKEVPVRHSKITSLSQQETMKIAFNNQVNSLKEIKHDGLLNVHDFFSEVGRQYVVMESVDGNDFGTLLQLNPGPFTLPETLGWADQLLDALNYLHSRNPQIIHRNITPSNVRLGADGKVRLLAFGSTGGHEVSPDSAQSGASSDVQSLNYAALEQIWDGLDAASQKVISNSYDERSERILKEPVDGRADLYSLAAFLYHLLTARKPVDALERSIDILEGKQDPLTPPHKLDASIPPEVSDVLMRALEIRREKRFDAASIMRQVLRTAMVRVREREAEEAASGHETFIAPPQFDNHKSFPQETKPEKVRAVIEKVALKEPETVQAPAPEVKKAAKAPVEPEKPVQPNTVKAAAPVFELDDDLLGLGNLASEPEAKTAPLPAIQNFEQHPEETPETFEVVEDEIPAVDEPGYAVEPEFTAKEETAPSSDASFADLAEELNAFETHSQTAFDEAPLRNEASFADLSDEAAVEAYRDSSPDAPVEVEDISSVPEALSFEELPVFDETTTEATTSSEERNFEAQSDDDGYGFETESGDSEAGEEVQSEANEPVWVAPRKLQQKVEAAAAENFATEMSEAEADQQMAASPNEVAVETPQEPLKAFDGNQEAEEEKVFAKAAGSDLKIESFKKTESETFDYSDTEYPETQAGTNFPIPIPVAAGAGVLLVFIVIGAFLFLPSGSSEPAVTPASTFVQSGETQQQLEAQQPAQDTIISETPGQTIEQNPAFLPQPEQVAGRKVEPTPKPKKPVTDPAKPKPEPKKTLTVDDLINDN